MRTLTRFAIVLAVAVSFGCGADDPGVNQVKEPGDLHVLLEGSARAGALVVTVQGTDLGAPVVPADAWASEHKLENGKLTVLMVGTFQPGELFRFPVEDVRTVDRYTASIMESFDDLNNEKPAGTWTLRIRK